MAKKGTWGAVEAGKGFLDPGGSTVGGDGGGSWPVLADEALYGLAGDFVRAALPITETDPASLLVQMLVGFGNAMGRGPHFFTGDVRHGGNEFAAVVGGTGCGKGMAWGRVAGVLSVVDEEWYTGRQHTSFPSGEAIPWAVRDSMVRCREFAAKGGELRQDVREGGSDDKRLFIRYPELREVFKVMHREGNTISPMLRTAFDGDRMENAGKTNPCSVREHHISFIGHITPDELTRTVRAAELSNGLVNRFLWVLTRSERDIPNPVRMDEATRDELAKAFRLALEFAKDEREYRRDAGAEAVWQTLYSGLKRRPDNLMGAVTERACPHVMRLALVYAVLDRDTAIRCHHLLAALAVWQYCESSAMRIFAPIVGDADHSVKVYRFLADQGADGATRTHINNQCFQRNADAATIDQAISRLEEMGAVRCEAERFSTRGRPSEKCYAVAASSRDSFVYSCDSVGLIDYAGTAKRVMASLSEPNSVRNNEINTTSKGPSIQDEQGAVRRTTIACGTQPNDEDTLESERNYELSDETDDPSYFGDPEYEVRACEDQYVQEMEEAYLDWECDCAFDAVLVDKPAGRGYPSDASRKSEPRLPADFWENFWKDVREEDWEEAA